MSAWILHSGVQTRDWRLCMKMCEPWLAVLHKKHARPGARTFIYALRTKVSRQTTQIF